MHFALFLSFIFLFGCFLRHASRNFKGRRSNEPSRYRLDHRRHSVGAVYDATRPCLILRRARARAQCIKRVYAMLRNRVPDELALAGCGLFNRLRACRQRILGRLGQSLSSWCRCRKPIWHAARSAVLRLSNDFRNHHSGLDRWGLCRADRICLCSYFFRPLAADLLRAGCALGLGRWYDGRWRHLRRDGRTRFCRRYRRA